MRPTKPPPRVHDPEVYCALADDTAETLRRSAEWYGRGSPAIGAAYAESARLIANAVAFARALAAFEKANRR